jgi:hypothetical protein
MKKYTITRTEEEVVLLEDGKAIGSFPPVVALQLIPLLQHFAMQILNVEDPERAVMDQAILNRAGVPIKLTDDNRIHAAADTAAQWDRDLRRSKIDGTMGVTSKGVVGTPGLKHGS